MTETLPAEPAATLDRERLVEVLALAVQRRLSLPATPSDVWAELLADAVLGDEILRVRPESEAKAEALDEYADVMDSIGHQVTSATFIRNAAKRLRSGGES